MGFTKNFEKKTKIYCQYEGPGRLVLTFEKRP